MTIRKHLTYRERERVIDSLILMSHLTTHASDLKTIRALCEWTISTDPDRGMLIAFAKDVDPGWFSRTVIAVLKHRHQSAPLPGLRVIK